MAWLKLVACTWAHSLDEISEYRAVIADDAFNPQLAHWRTLRRNNLALRQWVAESPEKDSY
jgi:hypothetical protein